MALRSQKRVVSKLTPASFASLPEVKASMNLSLSSANLQPGLRYRVNRNIRCLMLANCGRGGANKPVQRSSELP